MKMLVILLLACAGCTKTLESSATMEVYPHDPAVINKLNLGISMKGTW